jgi:hydroxyacylglutathione hydrolase
MPLFEPVHAFSDNYIWLVTDPPSPAAVVVDPGEASPVLEILHRRKLELGAVLLTHQTSGSTSRCSMSLAILAATSPIAVPSSRW